MKSPQYITFDILKAYSKLVCVFSTRKGGISVNEYRSLNLGLGTGDDEASVLENRKRFFSEIKVDQSEIAFTDQVHSSRVQYVTRPGTFLKTDALLTNKPNLFLAIRTADCFPVFLFDTKKMIVAAVHAGWRGVLKNIIENTIDKLITEYISNPADLISIIGPGMQKECFEIRSDMYTRISEKYLADHSDSGKKYFDLELMIYDKLLDRGLIMSNIFKSGICTKCDKENFYSYRRDKHSSGRMIGLIGMRE